MDLASLCGAHLMVANTTTLELHVVLLRALCGSAERSTSCQAFITKEVEEKSTATGPGCVWAHREITAAVIVK